MLADEQFKAHMPPEPLPEGPSEGAWILSMIDGGRRILETFDDVRAWPECMEMGACHTNAQRLADENPGKFRVVVGFASDPLMSRAYCAHAWLVDQDGVCWDPTWPQVGRHYVGAILEDPTTP